MVIAALVGFTTTSVLAAAKTRTIVCTSPSAPAARTAGTTLGTRQAYLDYSKRVQEATDGRITIVYRWGSALGKVSDFLYHCRKSGNGGRRGRYGLS